MVYLFSKRQAVQMELRWPGFILVWAMLVYDVLSDGAKFKQGEKVILYVNKVGPYFNPHETYHYYQLPVCRPKEVHTKRLSLGEVLDGDRMAESMYNIKFGEDQAETELCTVPLTSKDINTLSEAIEDLYYFEFILDQIPIRGFVGQLEEGSFVPHTHKVYLWTHHHFNIEHNDNQIIYVNVTTKDHEPLSLNGVEASLDVKFTYSIKWIKTSMLYSDRARRISSTSFFPKSLEIHWLSIINSLVLVFLLIGFVVIILTRILKSDFARYNPDEMEEMEELETDDGGWKIIHTDVFRFPPYKMLFCAILGCGSQFLAIASGIVLMALLGMFNVHKHGAINSAAVLLYAFTSGIAGFVAARTYKQMGGESWVLNVNLTSLLFAGPLFVVWAVVNSVAWAHGATQALPWTTVLLLMGLWLLVGYPLTVVGGIFGKNYAHGFDAPCRTKNIPREIPQLPVYKQPAVMSLVGGFLPFSAISVELYYIVATLWGREQYTLYGVLFLVYAILLVVTAAISVALTYFQLSAEDYRWWWRSIFSGGSTGLFVLCYALFYFFKRSQMSGDLQTLQFFGYMLLACYVFFLMLGTVSFFAALKFIRYIYVNIKMD